jgi:arginine decarboxylase
MTTTHAPADPAGSMGDGVDITVRSASGTGRTTLAAFDHALIVAGVANFNLLTLSSVIPPGSTVTLVEGAAHPVAGTHGDRLYCVLSSAYAVEPGQETWAGLGWALDPATGRGLFVEHAAATEADLRRAIEHSLGDMVAHRGGGYGEVRTVVASATCIDQPVCALAVAAYESAGWSPRV